MQTRYLLKSKYNQRQIHTTSNQKPSVCITRKLPSHVLENLKSKVNIKAHWNSEEPFPRSQLLESVRDVEGILCILEDRIDKEVIDTANKLKVISTISVGYDHIDVKECMKKGIKVGNTPGVLTETTADLTMALMLATARRIPEGIKAVKEGKWTNWKLDWLCGKDIYGSTVGIVGLGRIGLAVAKRLVGFDCKILYTGSKPKKEAETVNAKYVDFETLLKESDIVTAHCPLNDRTRFLFDSKAFSMMKKSSIFINTTRGQVVDQDALYEALHNNMILSAGIDVCYPEPLPYNHKLLSLDNLVVLPHIGSSTISTRYKMTDMALDNLYAGLTGINEVPYPVKI